VVAPVEVSHLGAVGCCSQLFRVRSLQLVMTSMSAMASAAITARVFMARLVLSAFQMSSKIRRILHLSFREFRRQFGLVGSS
jgi:hypothetical protein